MKAFLSWICFFQSITASLHAANTSDSVWRVGGGRYQISGGSRIPKGGMMVEPTPELGQKPIIWEDFLTVTVTAPDRNNCLFDPGLLDNTH